MENKESQITNQIEQIEGQNLSNTIQNKNPVSSSSNSCSAQNQQSSFFENKDFKNEKNREYVAKSRLKKSGLYQATLLEQAKDLVKVKELKFAELFQHEIWKQLSLEEQKLMKKFFVNLRQKEKRENPVPPKFPESKLNITQEQHNTISNVQISRNELISKELCASQNFENQVAAMITHNRQNHLAIFDFLKSLQNEPFENFFEVLIAVIKAVENCSQQTRLLVGLCGIYNGQKTSFDLNLCCQTLKYLANEDGVTSQQVIGFLKFTFVHEGDIHNADLSDLISFDQRHKQCFIGFKQWLQWTFRLPQDLTLVLPNSCYILGLPFVKRLKIGGNSLCQNIPSEFLELFIQILAFSFEKEEATFECFLFVAQCGFLELIEKIITTQFLNLFNALLNEIQQHNKQWYLNLVNSTMLIQNALKMVKERKIHVFKSEICKNLLFSPTTINEYLNGPSMIRQESSLDDQNNFRLFLQLNNDNQRVQKFLAKFDSQQKPPLENFIFLQIVPHYFQTLAMQLISQATPDHSHIFLNIGPGMGKTKTILSAAITFAQKMASARVVILNSNKTLSDRDFHEATSPLERLSISYASVLSQQAQITFLTTDVLMAQKDELPADCYLLLDEYQNVFFNEGIFDILPLLAKATSFIGFSGSPLNSTQKNLLEHCFCDTQTLVFQLTPQQAKFDNQETTVCLTQKEHIQTLSLISNQFRKEVPQVFILDASTAAAFLKGKKKQSYVSLINEEPTVINNTLSKLFNKPNDDGTFGTYIINEEMGTGTDFKTSTDIENKGGLVLVFGVKPTSTSTFEQLSCRVGRIFNKGRRFYIIQDPTYKGSSHDYLNYLLGMIKQNEEKEARELLNKIKKHNDKNNKQNNVEIQENNERQVTDASTEVKQMLQDQQKPNNVLLDDKRFHLNVNLTSLQNAKEQNLNNEKNSNTNKKRIQKASNKVNQQEKPGQQQQEECKYCENTHEEGFVCKAAIGKSQLATITDAKRPQINQQSLGSDTTQQLSAINENTQQANMITQKIVQKTSTTEEVEKHKESLDVTMLDEGDGASAQQKHTPQFSLPQKQNDLLKKRSAPTETSQLEQQIKVNIAKVPTIENKQNLEKQVSEEAKVKRKTNRQETMALSKTNKGKHNSCKGTIDDGYFGNYSNYDIHEEMLNDKIRCAKYREAIEKMVQDKTVLDLGSGTGVLSGYAVDAKAASVTAVDKANVESFMAKELKQEQIQKIQFINKSIEDLVMEGSPQIPQRVDVIVSEWMGYFLLQENMVESVLTARQNFLKPDGLMIPSHANMYLTIANIDQGFSEEIKHEHLSGEGKPKQVFIECCPGKDCLLQVDHTTIQAMDFTTNEQKNPLAKGFESGFNMEVAKEGTVTAFVGWFDVILCEGVLLSTSPAEERTHWKQSIFFLSKPTKVKVGDIIKGSICLSQCKDNYRNMIAEISYKVGGQQGKYQKEKFTFE